VNQPATIITSCASRNVAPTSAGSNAHGPGHIAQSFAKISHQNRNFLQSATAAAAYTQHRDHAVGCHDRTRSPKEEDEPATLRSAAVDALQSAARQNDPKEFDRLTRHALTLIERARAIGYRRQRDVSERDGAMVLSEHPTQEQAGPALSHRLKARCIAAIQWLFS
jgi:hypothetical protein